VKLNHFPHREHSEDQRAPSHRTVIAMLRGARVVGYQSECYEGRHKTIRWYCWVEECGFNHMNEEVFAQTTSEEKTRSVLWRMFAIFAELNEPDKGEWVDVSALREIMLHETVAEAAQHLAEEAE
jgi:hypothetical protein